MVEKSVHGRMALIEYYEERIKQEQERLDYMDAPWFRCHQMGASGELMDVTEKEKDSVRKAIADYRKAIEYLSNWSS